MVFFLINSETAMNTEPLSLAVILKDRMLEAFLFRIFEHHGLHKVLWKKCDVHLPDWVKPAFTEPVSEEVVTTILDSALGTSTHSSHWIDVILMGHIEIQRPIDPFPIKRTVLLEASRDGCYLDYKGDKHELHHGFVLKNFAVLAHDKVCIRFEYVDLCFDLV